MGGFAILMLGVSWRFYRQSKETQPNLEEDALRLAFVSDETGKFIWTPVAAFILASIGVLTGLMTGLLGVGGGFLIVPLMRRFPRLTVPGIVATSLFVITLVGSGGVINALMAGVQLPLIETSSFVAAMVGGMLVGRGISRKLEARMVQRGFALLLFGVSVYMLFKSFMSFEG
jgi:uncharacterized membrane protein YfcA